MKASLILAGVAASLAAPGMTASAQKPNAYINIGYTAMTRSAGVDLGAVTARLGVGLTENLAVEAEASYGVNDDNGVQLDNAFGLFGVASLPLGETFSIYGRAGFSRTATSPGREDDGIAYGVGAEFYLTPADGLRADVTRHDYDSGESEAYSLAYIRRF
jgi:hypothetical protein